MSDRRLHRVSKQNRRQGDSIWYTQGGVSSDYTTVGHVTADVMADGSRRPGGGAFYSALQAARLGRRVQIITRGVSAEIEQLLAPYRAEFELDVIEAPCTTTLATSGVGRGRTQRMLAWAGEIGADVAVDTAVLHLAPVARETPASWRGHADFVGLTPQGLVRQWSGIGAEVVPRALDPALLPERCDAIVLSASERDSCAALLKGDARDGRGPGARRRDHRRDGCGGADTATAARRRERCRAGAGAGARARRHRRRRRVRGGLLRLACRRRRAAGRGERSRTRPRQSASAESAPGRSATAPRSRRESRAIG